MLRHTLAVSLAMTSATHAAGALVSPEQLLVELLPGTQVSVLWVASDLESPVFGYSLDIDFVGVFQSAGSNDLPAGIVAADPQNSTFFPSQNIIVGGGGALDPFFTTILGDGSSGIFLTTISDTDSSYLPTPGVNDVLAEVVFTASEDALGDFLFSLGPGTAISDSAGHPIEFAGSNLVLRVVPSPSAVGILLPMLVSSSFIRRRTNKRRPMD